MCGISGYKSLVLTPGFNRDLLLKMAHSIRHRGPDGTGICVLDESHFGMAHNRLKIIDLSEAASQPMHDHSKRFVLGFNGEIYNYLEIRDELVDEGVKFNSLSDTEVLLELLVRHGFEALNRLCGMWAFVLFDKVTGNLYLGRDKLGKKPMYWARRESTLIFASEPKALLAAGVKNNINLRRLSRYLAWNYRFGEWNQDSFFSQIQSIPAGTVLKFDEELNCSTEWAWKPQFSQTEFSESDAIDLLRNELSQAVGLRLRSDVPVGAMVSGGLDSTSVVAMASKAHHTNISLFSGVTGKTRGIYDESPWVRKLVRYLNTSEAEFIHLDLSQFEQNCIKMVQIFDEPVLTVSFLPLFLLYQAIRERGIKVVLTGHGGDEVFAGYWHHFLIHFSLFSGKDRVEQIRSWRQVHQRPLREIKNSKYKSYLPISAYDFVSYEEALGNEMVITLQELHQERAENVHLDALNHRLFQELMYDHVPPVLKAEDRVSMGNGVESRCPLLDLGLIEKAFSVPGRLKISSGLNKSLLRKAMKDFLPGSISGRADKVGLNCPFDSWIRGHLKDYMMKFISHGILTGSGFLRPAIVDRLFKEHQAGASHGQFFWQLLQSELWIQEYGLESQF
ncbi:MAG: asparagine synthase (glutamine-hydrolyzing) [Candidatus Cloacimonetes bacterium]|nr:asparagine synthase (glutamine-hydrolyzing) [Candidatus Cloacimonadota bacterium]